MTSFALAAADAELLQASNSPDELARYIEIHRTFDWRPLWGTLGLWDLPIIPCEEPFRCAMEQIKITAPPRHRHPKTTRAQYLAEHRGGLRDLCPALHPSPNAVLLEANYLAGLRLPHQTNSY